MSLTRTSTCKSSKHFRAWMWIWALDLVSTVLWRTLTYSTQVEWLYAILAWLHGEDISSVNASRQMQIVCVLWVEDGAHRASIATPEQRNCRQLSIFKSSLCLIRVSVYAGKMFRKSWGEQMMICPLVWPRIHLSGFWPWHIRETATNTSLTNDLTLFIRIYRFRKKFPCVSSILYLLTRIIDLH